MSGVGVFPLDVWRIVLHNRLTMLYDDKYWNDYGRIHATYYTYNSFGWDYLNVMAKLLRELSLIHPKIKIMLHDATRRHPNHGFKLVKLYNLMKV